MRVWCWFECVVFSIVETQRLVHARLIVGPIYGAEVSFLVGDDEHLADGRVEMVHQQEERVSHRNPSKLQLRLRQLSTSAVQRRHARAARIRLASGAWRQWSSCHRFARCL